MVRIEVSAWHIVNTERNWFPLLIGFANKQHNYRIARIRDSLDRAIRQFWQRLAFIITVKSSHAEHLNTVFLMAALHCYDTVSYTHLTLPTKRIV